MEPLVEVHTDREMEIALDCGAIAIGVNNRNLHTFQLDLDTTRRVLLVAEKKGKSWRGSQADICIAALSGISSSEVHSRKFNSYSFLKF
jgi:anthranilate synthase/indole-3-glycerol phosphate synthase/phosphoribosylanthranilate isomerase